MINQLVRLILPKQLGIEFGTALAVTSFVSSIAGSRSSRKRQQAAQAEQRRVEERIRREQAVRERKRQVRTANILTAQAEAVKFASGSGRAGDTDIAGARAGVSSNLSRNILDINTSLSQGSALSAAQEGVANAGRGSTLDIFNQQLQPLIFGNIDKLNSLFSSDTGTP